MAFIISSLIFAPFYAWRVTNHTSDNKIALIGSFLLMTGIFYILGAKLPRRAEFVTSLIATIIIPPIALFASSLPQEATFFMKGVKGVWSGLYPDTIVEGLLLGAMISYGGWLYTFGFIVISVYEYFQRVSSSKKINE